MKQISMLVTKTYARGDANSWDSEADNCDAVTLPFRLSMHHLPRRGVTSYLEKRDNISGMDSLGVRK